MPTESSGRDDPLDRQNARFEARRGPIRVLITCSRPAASRAAGLAWLRAELARVALDPDVRLVSLTELEPVGRGELEDAFLIELDLAEGCDADRLVERGPLALFHSELRSLRLKPSIALAPSPVGIILPTDHA